MLIIYAYEFSRKQPLTDHLKKNSGVGVGGVGVLARDIITIPVGRGGGAILILLLGKGRCFNIRASTYHVHKCM